jgi:hypothetical protein
MKKRSLVSRRTGWWKAKGGDVAKDWSGGGVWKDGTIYAWHRSEGRRYADGSGLRLG